MAPRSIRDDVKSLHGGHLNFQYAVSYYKDWVCTKLCRKKSRKFGNSVNPISINFPELHRGLGSRSRRSWQLARSIRPNIPIWISEFFVCRGERYFPPGRTDLVLFPLEHSSHQDLLDKMLKDNDEVAVSVVNCFMRRNSTRIHDYFKLTLTRYLPDRFKDYFFEIRNLWTFLVGDYKNRANAHRKFGTTSTQFSRRADPKLFVEDSESIATEACHLDRWYAFDSH